MTGSASSLVTPEPTTRHLWAVLLAGGDGVRMRDLTLRIAGDDRPKQFCPIFGSESLLAQTRMRIAPIVAADRQVFVVSSVHERYYSRELADATESHILVQPINRGTAVAIILALIHIMQLDPEAMVGIFPCDHYYSDDVSFRSTIRSAALGAELFIQSLLVVGAQATYPETEYGWIEPHPAILHSGAGPLFRVSRFWEKPPLRQAQAFLRRGCVWNTFVTVGNAFTFLELICSEVPEVVLSVTRALVEGKLLSAYSQLPRVDFSRDVLVHQARRLLLLRDSGSGWADLGSPERVFGLLSANAERPAWFDAADALRQA